jgi:hemoglobin
MKNHELNLLCTQEDVHQMVHAFYGVVRQDPHLGPIFERQINDWAPHLDRMVDFWSNLLRGTGQYHGSPMPMHMKLPELNAVLFQRWLALFKVSTLQSCAPQMAVRANFLAERIAQSLWFAYQMRHAPNQAPQELSLTEAFTS